MSPDPFDLSAFRKPATATTRPQQAPKDAKATQSTEEPDPPAADLAAAKPPAAARRRAPRVAGPTSDGRLVLALSVPLRDRARAVAASKGETYADVILRAIQHTHDQLPALLATRHHHAEGPTVGALFEHRTKTRRTPEATAQVTIRGLSQHDRRVLDQLVDDVGATTLTELVTVALDEDLPHRPRSMR